MGSSRRRGAAAIIVALLVLAVAAATAPAHGTRPAGMSEKRWRALEQRALGPRHAAEHARRRAILRDKKLLRRLQAQARRTRLASRRRARAANVSESGRWMPAFDLPVFAINTVQLPTGQVLMWAYDYAMGPRDLTPQRNWSNAFLWDPAKGYGASAFEAVHPPKWDHDGKPGTPEVQANIWCSGQSLLADGRVLVTGGNLGYETANKYYKGLNHVYTFNPWTKEWTRHEDMKQGRWYPTQTLLPDGRTLIMSGLTEKGDRDNNLLVEIFDPAAPLGQEITQLTGTRVPYAGTGNATPPEGEPYAHVFAMPSGNVLVAGPYEEDSWLLRPPFDALSAWTDIPAEPVSEWANGGRYAGNGILVPGAPSKVMLLGGGADDTPTATTAIFDENEAAAGWKPGPSWNVARSHANTVILPDGSLAAIGGGLGDTGTLSQWTTTAEQRQIELLPRGASTWRKGPAQAEARAYHSTALLLADGRVLSAGDDVNGGHDRDTGELYEPAYLHQGSRPKITGVTRGVLWGDTFRVAVRSEVAVERVVLMAPGAVTHAVDMHQRLVELQRSGDGWRAPASPQFAPPGYYMMFAIDGRGVPSVAEWVRLGAAGAYDEIEPEPTPEPTPTPTPTPTATPSPTPTPALEPTPTATPAPDATPDPTPTATPAPTAQSAPPPAPAATSGPPTSPAGSPATPAVPTRRCASFTIAGRRFRAISVRGSTCWTARALAKRFRALRVGPTGRALGYRCRARRPAGSSARTRQVTCIGPAGRRVTWTTGSTGPGGQVS
jgi:hypothetical protein